MMVRYIVIGAGAVGGGLGGLVADAGGEAVLVARGPHAEAMRTGGLTIRLPERTMSVPVACVVDPSELVLAPDDVLVLTTKTHQAEAALRSWVDQPVVDGERTVGTAGELLPVVTALNGVTAEHIALRYFDRVIGACVWMPAVHLDPGEVIVRGTPVRGTFHVGAMPSGRDESTLLAAIDADWTRAGFRVVRPEEVMPWKYRKLISNIGNAFHALVGDRGRTGWLVQAAQEEARAVLLTAGVDVIDDETEAAERAHSGLRIVGVPGEPTQIGGSSWQSLARGTGDIESDYLNGEIARLGRLHGHPAPINAGVTRLARRAAADGRRPGDLSAEELGALLGVPPVEGQTSGQG